MSGSNQVQVLEASSELLEHFATQEKQRQEEAEAYKQAILNMSPTEMHEFLEDHLTATDIIMESLGICSNMNVSDSIFVTSLNRLRTGIESTLMWMESKLEIQKQEANPEAVQNKNESPRTDGKRIVYGANDTEDESEQL